VTRRLAIAAALAATLTAGAAALAPPAQAKTDPLVFVVVIDGLDGDRVDDGKAPFISSLLAGEGGDTRATYFEESRSVMIAETNPNHAAMMTGAYGDKSGLPGNAFALYAPLENEDSCKRTGKHDRSQAPTPTSGEHPSCLTADTVFAAIKRQEPRLVTAAIFGKPKLGRIFAGKTVNRNHRDVDHLWAPCGADDDEDYCGDVPTNPISGYAIDDKTVMDEVIRTIREGVPERGKLRQPDFTFVNLHQVDSAGHATMPGPIYDGAIALADLEVERLVDELKSRGQWKRTVLILLSDHSMDGTPAKRNMQGVFTDAGIDEDDFTIVQNGSVDAVYLNDRKSKKRFGLLERLREAALDSGFVTEALYREPNPEDGDRKHTVDRVHPGWHAAGKRSGDLLLIADEGEAFTDPSESSNPLPGNHGGPQTRDNFFAVVGGSKVVRQRTLEDDADDLFDDTLDNERQAENVDVAPTVTKLFGLDPPRNSKGRFLEEAFDL
jgi:predicted AlkP superfamily pyrophosphatase or phosphodiesterase